MWNFSYNLHKILSFLALIVKKFHKLFLSIAQKMAKSISIFVHIINKFKKVLDKKTANMLVSHWLKL